MNQFRLSTLLLIVLVVAILLVIYPAGWNVSKAASSALTTLLFVAVGVEHGKGRGRDYILGAAVVAGILGANLAMIVHFLLSFTSPTSFDSRGYSFFDTVLMFAPVSSLIGAGAGASIFWFGTRLLKLSDQDG